MKSIQHLHIINIQDEYGTPKEKFNEKCKELKLKLTRDLAASQKNHVINSYITKEMDLFSIPITENSFLNPPYSKVSKFIKYAYEQHKLFNVDILILTYSKTDTRWWHEFVEKKAEVYFIKGRLKFLDENGVIPKRCDKCKLSVKYLKGKIPICPSCKSIKLKENLAPYPSVWILYRKKIKLYI